MRSGQRAFAFAALFALAMLVGRATRVETSELALVWPASGVAVLWLSGVSIGLRRSTAAASGDRRLDAVLLVLVAVAVNYATGASLLLAVVLAAANLVHAGAVIAVWRRYRSRWELMTARDLQVLLVASLVGSVAGGLMGTFGLWLAGGDDLATQAGAFVVRNLVSTFVLVALGLCLGNTAPGAQPGRLGLALLVVAGGVPYLVVFGLTRGLPIAYLVLPIGVWVAARYTTTIVAWYLAATASMVVVLTLGGLGPFAAGSASRQALLAQAFIAVSALLTLTLALQRDERERLQRLLTSREHEATAQQALLTTVFDNISDGVMVVDADGALLLHNPAARELLGLDVDASNPDSWVQYYGITQVDGSELPTEQLPLVRALHGHRSRNVDLLVHNPERDDGLVLAVSAQPLPIQEGPAAAIAAFHDVTDVRRAAARVEQARDLFAGVLAAATEQAIIGTDPEGLITVFNVGAQRMLGYTEQEMLGSTPERLHDPAEVLARAAEFGIAPGFGVFVHQVVEGRAETRLWTYLTAQGRRLSVHLTVSTISSGNGAVTGYIGLAVDVTAQQHAEQSLRDSETRFRSAFETAPMGMLLAAADDKAGWRVIQVNPALCGLLNRSSIELTEAGLLPYVHPDDQPAVQQDLSALLGALPDQPALNRVHLEVRFLRPDGAERWGLLSASLIQATPDSTRQVIALVEDITARKHAEQSLKHQALHDGLTGLANRTLLQDRAEHVLAGAARSGRAVGLLFLDLDGFKAVNDLAGHAAGDELLMQIAQRLLAVVRPGDTVSRLGGDEFAVLCPDADTPAQLTAIAHRVLAAVRMPVPLAAGTHSVSASIGLAIAQPGTTAAQLLHDADVAMYSAKRTGKDRLVLHDNADDAQEDHSVRLLPAAGD